MPLYKYLCPNNHETEKIRSVKKFTERIRCHCGKRATICISTRLFAQTFKPYVDPNFTGEPIEITSKEQRDNLCKAHGVTYDSVKSVAKPKMKAAVEDLDFADVKRSIETGRLPDGSKLEEPTVVDADSFD